MGPPPIEVVVREEGGDTNAKPKAPNTTTQTAQVRTFFVISHQRGG